MREVELKLRASVLRARAGVSRRRRRECERGMMEGRKREVVFKVRERNGRMRNGIYSTWNSRKKSEKSAYSSRLYEGKQGRKSGASGRAIPKLLVHIESKKLSLFVPKLLT